MEIDRGRPNSKTKREQTSNFDAASYSGHDVIGICITQNRICIPQLQARTQQVSCDYHRVELRLPRSWCCLTLSSFSADEVSKVFGWRTLAGEI